MVCRMYLQIMEKIGGNKDNILDSLSNSTVEEGEHTCY